MKVSQAMSRDVRIASPNDSLSEVAKIMAAQDIGFMPVGEDDRLIGTVTDRDIVVRGLAKGKDGSGNVRDVMTRDVMYCFDDQEIEEVVQNMGDIQVRRLPVVDRDKRLVGVVSLGDAALKQTPAEVGAALSGVSQRGGQHAQEDVRR